MSSNYRGVVTRLLDSKERLVSTSEGQTPLVIEPQQSADLDFLRGFLAEHTAEINADIASHGAVLLRGFRVQTEADFESTVLAIRTMRGIHDVFMSETGRDIVEGSRYVLYTNSRFKTGGTLAFTGFHSENHQLPDVPRFISFFCRVPSSFGGETGLVNLAGLYSDLPPSVKEKLEASACFLVSYPVWRIAERYGIPADSIQALCKNAGLPMIMRNGQPVFRMYKPSVLVHPVTGERVLVINFTAELDQQGLKQAIIRAFWDDYRSARWAVHRLKWRHPKLFALRSQLKSLARRQKTAPAQTGQMAPQPTEFRVGSAFTKPEIESLAQAMRKRFTSFVWHPGDVLLVDNIKMAHAGMPGFGSRLLRAMICNPTVLIVGQNAPGLYAPVFNEDQETLGAQIERLRGAPPQTVASHVVGS